MSPLLEVERLTKTYRGGWGVHDVTFTLPRGTIAALGGPNGSGKSTLLRCLAGLARASGTVRVDGLPLAAPDVRTRIGYLPQSVAFPEQATIGEVLELFARLRGVEARAVPLPRGFLRDDDVAIGELSGGQRNRVAVAASLLGAPSLLLLDEPVAGLDADGRADLWSTLATLRDRDGVTAIVSSPWTSELTDVVDRHLFLEDGRLVDVGPDGAIDVATLSEVEVRP
jgi:ABC-type multidrug transport system ATPase subunit